MTMRHRVESVEWEFDGEHFVWPANSPMTLAQVAEVSGSCREVIRKLEKEAIEKLKVIATEDIADVGVRGRLPCPLSTVAGRLSKRGDDENSL